MEWSARHDYGLPPIPQNEFSIQRVNTSFFIFWDPADEFWKEVAEERRKFTEWQNKEYKTKFTSHFRSQFGFKDKATAAIGYNEFLQSIMEAGKVYVQGGYVIPEDHET
jgi:hypothetical protein